MADPVRLGPAAIDWLQQTPQGQAYAKKQNIAADPQGNVVSQPHGAEISWGPLGSIASWLADWAGSGRTTPPAPPSQPAAPAAPAAGTTDSATAAANARAAAQQWNPLAVNMFYATAIAPMLQQLAGKFQTTDQNLLNMAQNTPGQQYIPKQYQALSNQILGQMGLDANNVSQALLGAAVTAPVIDSLQQQMSTLSQRALQSYTEALRQGQTGTLDQIFGGTTPTGQTGTVNVADVQSLVNSLTQPTG